MLEGPVIHRHVSGGNVGGDVSWILVNRFLETHVSTEVIPALGEELPVEVDRGSAVRIEGEDPIQEVFIGIHALQRLQVERERSCLVIIDLLCEFVDPRGILIGRFFFVLQCRFILLRARHLRLVDTSDIVRKVRVGRGPGLIHALEQG